MLVWGLVKTNGERKLIPHTIYQIITIITFWEYNTLNADVLQMTNNDVTNYTTKWQQVSKPNNNDSSIITIGKAHSQ